MKNSLKGPGNEYEIYNEIPKLQEWKFHWKGQGMNMRFTMNLQATRMKNTFKVPGNEYKIFNEIPKVEEWKIHWKS